MPPLGHLGILLVGFLGSLTASLLAVPQVRRWSLAWGLVDAPGERKIHQTPVPRLGGVAIWLAFMLGFWGLVLLRWHYPHDNGISGLMAGGTILFAMGVVDDVRGLSPYVKLFIQFLAATVAFWLGVEVTSLDLPDSKLLVLNAFSYPITVLWLVGIANALNFIDGLDGLAGGVTVISALTLVVVALFTHQPVAALIAALLAASTLGFLIYNFHPARLFMGDSGALFCGFMLAGIAVTGVLKTQVVVMLLPAVVLSVPLLDITYSTLRRVFLGQNPFLPDADHLHHRLLKAGFSSQNAVAAFYAVCILAGMVATGYVHSLGAYVALMTLMTVFTAGLYGMIRGKEIPAEPPAESAN